MWDLISTQISVSGGLCLFLKIMSPELWLFLHKIKNWELENDSSPIPVWFQFQFQIRCWIPFQWDVRSCAGSNAGFCKRYRITWCHTTRSPICVTTKWPKLYVSKSREIRSRLQYFCFSDVWVCCSNFLFHMSLTLSQSCHSCMLSILMCCNFLQ